MKIRIQEIEEFEVTDPAGLCDPPVQQGIPIQQQPMPPMLPSGPSLTTPWPTTPAPIPCIPGINPVSPTIRPGSYTRPIHGPYDPLNQRTKWGVGGNAIQEAGDALEQEKWEKNLQASVGGDVPEDGNGNNH